MQSVHRLKANELDDRFLESLKVLWGDRQFQSKFENAVKLCGQCPPYKFHLIVGWALPTISQPVANKTITDRYSV
jgi:hypothetical protein